MARAAPVRSISLLAALCVFVLWAPESSFSVVAQGTPQMVLKQQIHDFKDVLEGEILTYTFEVLNQGDATLRIERVQPECTCSVAEFDAFLLPGGAGKITVRIDTKGFEGKQRWAVKVVTNDPKWTEAVLDLRASVKRVITITGSPVFLGGKKKGAMTGEVEISTELNQPLILTPEQFTLSGRVTYYISEIEKEKRYKVTFQDVSKKRENYRGFLKLKTNMIAKPTLTISIIGRFDL